MRQIRNHHNPDKTSAEDAMERVRRQLSIVLPSASTSSQNAVSFLECSCVRLKQGSDGVFPRKLPLESLLAKLRHLSSASFIVE